MTNVTAKKTSQKDGHPSDIKAAINKNGYTLSDIAKAEGLLSSSSLSAAMHSKSYPINELRLAKYACVPVQEMFPERYYSDGTKRPRGIRGAMLRAKSKQTGYKNNA